MKKLLIALLAITTASAFAGNSMVRLDGCFDGQCDNLDLRMAGDDVENSDVALQNIALNYAHSFGNWGAGLTYKMNSRTADGDKADPAYSLGGAVNNSNEIIISGYYNVDGSWDDSCFVGLHIGLLTVEDGDATDDSGWKGQTITLEYGHRFKLGSLGKVNFNWAPSVSYAMATLDRNADGADDIKTTDLKINAVNVAVTY